MSEEEVHEYEYSSAGEAVDHQFLLPLRSRTAAAASTTAGEEEELVAQQQPSRKKKRRRAELQQLEQLTELQETLQSLREKILRATILTTQAKSANRVIRERTVDRTARLQRKRLRQYMKALGSPNGSADTGLPTAYFKIRPELAELLGISPNAYVRRQDILSLVATYAKKHQVAEEGGMTVTPALRRVIGDEWAERIEKGEKVFNSFTFGTIAKERQLFLDRAPNPNRHQSMEIFSALGYNVHAE